MYTGDRNIRICMFMQMYVCICDEYVNDVMKSFCCF